MSIAATRSPYPLVPLGEILTKSEDWIDILPDQRYRQVTIKMWGQGVMQRNEVAGGEIAASRRLRVRAGQFILSRIDARNGAIGIVPPELDGAVVSNDFPAFEVATNRVLPEFLGWMARTHDFVELCKAASEGTTNRVRLQEDRLLALTIPLPPLAEQRRFVARIEEIAAKIAEARRLREEAVGEAEVIWEIGARRIIENIAANEQTLRSLVSVQGGGTPTKSNPFFWDGLIPWVSPKDMKSREIFDATDHISEDATKQSPAKLLEPGAVLIVVRGMILAHTVPIAILRTPAAINQDMKALLPNGRISPEYLCHVLWGLNKHLLSLVEKSTHDTRKFETAKLLDFCIPLPPLAEQRHVVAELDALQAKVDALQTLQAETVTELDAMLPAVLDRAFRGEL